LLFSQSYLKIHFLFQIRNQFKLYPHLFIEDFFYFAFSLVQEFLELCLSFSNHLNNRLINLHAFKLQLHFRFKSECRLLLGVIYLLCQCFLHITLAKKLANFVYCAMLQRQLFNLVDFSNKTIQICDIFIRIIYTISGT